MGLEFRRRDYRAEDQAHSLRRTRAHTHPLSAPFLSPLQVEESECGKDDFCDPLRANDGSMEASASDVHREDVSSEATVPADLNSQLRVRKEWISFKKMLMHRFLVSKTSPISMQASGVLVKGIKDIGSNREIIKRFAFRRV